MAISKFGQGFVRQHGKADEDRKLYWDNEQRHVLRRSIRDHAFVDCLRCCRCQAGLRLNSSDSDACRASKTDGPCQAGLVLIMSSLQQLNNET